MCKMPTSIQCPINLCCVCFAYFLALSFLTFRCIMDGLLDQKLNIRFVQTVQKYPVIYNTKIKGYKHKQCIRAREKAWTAISEQFKCDVLPLQKKWRNFRATLLQKLSQKQKGQDAQPYYLYDYIKFLIPYLEKSYEPRESNAKYEKTDNEEIKGQVNQQCAEEYEIDGIDQNTMNYEYYDSDEIITTKQKPSLSSLKGNIITVEPTERSSNPQHRLKRKPNAFSNRKFMTSAHSTPLSNATRVVSTPIGNTELEELANGEYAKKHFLFSLIPDLNEMSNSQMRHFKYKVLGLIDEVLKEN
ncbi:uncharacterized protein LOC105664859 [Ceratitis capitata]|uniref:uncharacterized protein LOC105664859 n=1 Tax=Ceratitis capitata TaxID=7213 RepID=UPI000618964A|nr:uncharacterized protein LOC105664859 [Ceratitis capitata]